MKFRKKLKIVFEKEFDNEPVYNAKCVKAEIKSYIRKISTSFCNNKIPNEDSQFICLSVFLIDSVFRTGQNYYPQVSLEERKQMPKYITDDIKLSSDPDRENPDEQISDKENFDEKSPEKGNSDKES